jgi:fucose 4-O-acetylase-like acetyltransferase
MLNGLIIAQNIDLSSIAKLLECIPLLNNETIITEFGKHSLNLYTGHFVIFTVLFSQFMKA